LHPASAIARYLLSEGYAVGNTEKSLFNAERALELPAADSVVDEQMRKGIKAHLEERIKRLKE
jgi:hypothetical protein